MSLANDVIDLVNCLETDRKHYRLIEQLEAAVTSIPMNIAEGKGRDSKKEYTHFLHIARGSLYETLTLLEIFHMQAWIESEKFLELEQKSTEIAKMLNGLTMPYQEVSESFPVSHDLPPMTCQPSAISHHLRIL